MLGFLSAFVGPFVPMFWTSDDVCARFQSQVGSLCLFALLSAWNGRLRFTSGATPFGRQHWWGSRPGSFVREVLFCLFKSSQCILPVNTANFSVKKIVNTVGESLSGGVSLTENSLCRDPYWTETSPLRRPPWTET